ncbi:hypothetical protein OROMI_018542 [Orobanche minor]
MRKSPDSHQRDNETAEPCENHLPSENKIEEADHASVAVNEEWTEPTTDTALIDSGANSDILCASDGIIQTDPINKSEGTSAYADKDAATVLDQTEALPSAEQDFAEVDHEQPMGNEEKDKDGYGGNNETELREKDYGLPEMMQDAATKLIPDVEHGGSDYSVQDEIYGNITKEQLDVEFQCT